MNGKRNFPEWEVWRSMKKRCYTPSNSRFKDYGGRGITVCDRWRKSFDAFLADMGPRPSPDHSIERKDNNGNYEPSNCRWATRTEQGRNKRNNVIVEYRGKRQTLREWSAETGIKYSCLYMRIQRSGLTPETGLFEVQYGKL